MTFARSLIPSLGHAISGVPDLGVLPAPATKDQTDMCVTNVTVVTTNASAANTKGDYTEITSALANDCYGMIVQMNGNVGFSRDFLIDISTGAAGAESVLVADMLCSELIGVNFNARVGYIPVYIRAGTRVAARAAVNAGTSQTAAVRIQFLNRRSLIMQPRWSETYGANSGDSGGTSIDPGASINTKGAYVTVGTTTRRISQLCAFIGTQLNTTRGTCAWFVDIALTAGAEVIIIPDFWLTAHATTDLIAPMYYGPFAVDIPSGTAIRVRAQCSINDATDRLFDIVLYGFAE